MTTTNSSSPRESDDHPCKTCSKHDRELSLYCKECIQEICSKCLSGDHSNHDIVNLDVSKLLSTKQELTKHQSICMERLTRSKETLLKCVAEKFDQIMKEASDTTKREISRIDDEMDAVIGRLAVVNGVSNGGEDSPRSLSRRTNNRMKIDTSKRISATNLSGERSYKYFDYPETDSLEEDVERLCGQMVTMEMHVTLSGTNGVADVSVVDDHDFSEDQVCSPAEEVPNTCFQQ